MSGSRFQIVLSLLTLVLSTAPVLGLGADHPRGPIAGNDKWPAGLLDLANRTDRVHGFWVNWEDIFFYAGDTKALNEFLTNYAKLPNTVVKVVLHPGAKKARSPWDKEDRDIPVEWKLYASDLPRRELKSDGKFHTQVDVYLGGRVKLEDLQVPTGVTVESGGEIERFVTDHAKKK